MQGLREEHSRKVRRLLASIDGLEKQLSAEKAKRNESRRQQMIPLFRQKVKEQELTIDVLKHALCKPGRAEMTMKEVDEFIIRQTLGGPKRFRPASREEMELRIASLEQQLKQCQSQQAKARQQSSLHDSQNSKLQEKDESVTTLDADPMEEIAMERYDADEIERLHLLLQSKDELLHRQEATITELQAIIHDNSAHCDQCKEYEADLRALQTKYDRLQSTHHGIVRQHDEVQEQLDQVCAQAELDKADAELELEALREQVERLLERNAELLGEINAKDEELMQFTLLARTR